MILDRGRQRCPRGQCLPFRIGDRVTAAGARIAGSVSPSLDRNYHITARVVRKG